MNKYNKGVFYFLIGFLIFNCIYLSRSSSGIIAYINLKNDIDIAEKELKEKILYLSIFKSMHVNLKDREIYIDTLETLARYRLVYGLKNEKIFICQ